MNTTHSLQENIQHGTPKEPIYIHRFYGSTFPALTDCFHVDRHWHHNIECLLIQKGRYKIELNMDTIILEKGDICFINSGELHMLTGLCKDTCHDAIIFNPHILSCNYNDRIQEEIIAPLLTHTTVLPHIISKESIYYTDIFTRLSNIVNNWFELCNHKKPSSTIGDSYLYTKLTLYELMHILYTNHLFLESNSVLSASEKEKIDCFKSIVSYLQMNMHKKITLEHLSEVAQYNPQYLCQFFKSFAGITPIQYLINLRIEYACTLLQETTKSILEISLDCGFDNVSYFIRQFKEHLHMTPNQYRKKHSSPQ